MHKKKYTVVFVVCLTVLLLFKYEMLPGSIFVLPIVSLLFSLAFVYFKRGDISLHHCCSAVYKWKQMCVRSDCSALLFIACHMYKLN